MECSNILSNNSLLIKTLNPACPLTTLCWQLCNKEKSGYYTLFNSVSEFLIPRTKEITFSSVAAKNHAGRNV